MKYHILKLAIWIVAAFLAATTVSASHIITINPTDPVANLRNNINNHITHPTLWDVGGTATTSIRGNRATTTFSEDIRAGVGAFYTALEISSLRATSTTATSTFANGITISGGSFGVGTTAPGALLAVNGKALVGDELIVGGNLNIRGSCTGCGGLSGGTADRVAFWTGATSLSSNANFGWNNTAERISFPYGSTTQSLSIGNLLNVSGAGTSTFTGGISAAGLASSNGLTVSAGAAQLQGGLTVSGTATSTFSVPLSGTSLSASSGLTITGGQLLATGIGAILGSTTAVSPSFSSGAVVSSGDLFVSTGKIVAGGTGTSTFSSLDTSANLRVQGNLEVLNGIKLAGALNVTSAGTSTYIGGISSAGLASSAGLLISTGDLIVSGGKLTISGSGTSTISGGLSVGTTGGLASSAGLTITGGSILATNIGAVFGSTTAVSPSFSNGAVISSGDLLVSTGKLVSGGTGTSTYTGGISAAALLSTTGGIISNAGDILLTGGKIVSTGAGTSTYSGGISSAGLASSNGLRVSSGDMVLAGGLAVTGSSNLTGNVGIASTSPWGNLSVEITGGGTFQFDSPAFVVGDTGTSTPIFFVSRATSTVSVGTTTPATTSHTNATFVVQGTSIFQGPTRCPWHNLGNSGTALTIDAVNGKCQFTTLTGNVTITWKNYESGDVLILKALQDATGGRTIAWPSGTQGGANPLGTASRTTYFGGIFFGSNFHHLASTTNYTE